MRARLAPSARRAASSPRLVMPRTSTSPATLTQTTTSSSALMTLMSTVVGSTYVWAPYRRLPERHRERAYGLPLERVLGGQSGRQHVGLRARRRQRHSRTRPCESLHPRIPAIVEPVHAPELTRLRQHRHRDEHIVLDADNRPTKLRIRNANDGEGKGVQSNRPADDVRVGPKLAPPEAVRDHNDGMAARIDLIGGQNRSAALCTHAEGLEVIAGDELAGETYLPFLQALG